MNASTVGRVLVIIVLGACGTRPPPPISGSRVEPPAKAQVAPSPYDYTTWTKKLDDPREADRAITELEQLGNPAAIPALGKAWQQQKSVRTLQVIVSLARPLTADDARAMFLTDYGTSGRKASWDAARPFLVEAVAKVDVGDPRSVDSAIKAADAIGEAQLVEGLDALIDIASMPPMKQIIAAQVGAVRAMGKLTTAKKRAAAALIKLVDRVPPAHPRTAADPAQGREMEERFGLHLALTGASINALGELRTAAATKSLVLAMYRVPELSMQIRRALVASGPTAKEELREILRGENTAVNDFFAANRLDKYCGDKGDAKNCERVSAKDFYAASVVGDFYDAAVSVDLLLALRRPPLPAYYIDDAPAPVTQHNAIFDALRKIGAADAAAPVRAMWMKKGVDLNTRILAVGAYPFLARDAAGVDDLGKIAADNTADDTLRMEAATALARLSTSKVSIDVLLRLADKYLDASAKRKKEAEGLPKHNADAADRVFEGQKKTLDAAKTNLLALTKDASKSADDIRVATATVKKMEDDYKDAARKHKNAVAPYKQLVDMVKAYRGFARMFQTHVARIEIAIRCKQDLACLAASLELTPDAAAKNVAPYIKDIADWTPDEKLGLVEAAIERAMLEIGKRGDKASELTDTLLAAVTSDLRLVRQSILLALPRIAKIPCTTCEAKLDAAIKAGEGKSTLGDLNLETTMVRNYFSWAGRTDGP